jgi:hypothetical protein
MVGNRPVPTMDELPSMDELPLKVVKMHGRRTK